MARFFVDVLPAEGSEYQLTGENLEHAKVLRLKAGETVQLSDGDGLECICEVVAAPGVLSVGTAFPCPAEPRAAVSVYLAFPKADKAEHVIQKATELGAAEIVLFPSRFCVSRPDEKSLGKKLERWQRIAQSAAEQSRRGRIPRVRALGSFDAAIREAAGAGLPILFYENERARTLRAALEAFLNGEGRKGRRTMQVRSAPTARWAVAEHREELCSKRYAMPFGGIAPTAGNGTEAEIGTPPHPSAPRALTPSPQGEGSGAGSGRASISLMTGAEGGFADEEVARAEAAGMRICTLGRRILRCETAPLAALSAVMYALGEM